MRAHRSGARRPAQSPPPCCSSSSPVRVRGSRWPPPGNPASSIFNATSIGSSQVPGSSARPGARASRGEGVGPGWSWDDLAYYYAAPIAAAQYRENAVDLTLRPGASPGAPVSYEVAPAGIHGLRIDNQMQTGAATTTMEFVARR